MRFLFILFLSFISFDSIAFEFTEEICKQYGLGSNWYCKKSNEAAENTQDEEILAKDILNADILPEQKALELNSLWDRQIKRATISENPKDILHFLETHNLITSKGINFSRNVQRLIDSSPKLFNSESYYKNIVDQQIKLKENKDLLLKSSERYGIVFVYSASCHHCLRQLPIILAFKEEYNFTILGITTDNNHFAGMDENITDPRVIYDPLVQSYPTILLLDRDNPQKIFITKGLTTFDELEEKIAKTILEREKKEVNHEKSY